jgi:hypothetical protein
MPVRRSGIGAVCKRLAEPVRLQSKEATRFIFTHGSKNTCWARNDRTVHLAIVPRSA